MYTRSFLKAASVFILLSISASLSAQKNWKYTDVPDPKASTSWNYVSNPDKVLSDFAVAEINNYLKELEDSTTDQVAVVVVKNIQNDKTPRDFATALFRHWGIGRRDINNGLLILLVTDQRRIEFEVGYGLEATLTDILTKQIQERFMVPYAKSGDYDNCVLAGVQQVGAILRNQAIAGTGEENYAAPLPATPYPQSYSDTGSRTISRTLILGFIVVFLLIYFFIKKMILAKSKLNQHNSFRTVRYQFIQFSINAAFAAAMVLGSGFAYWWQLVIFLYLYLIVKQLVKTQAITRYAQTAHVHCKDRVETYKIVRLHKLAVPRFLRFILPFPITLFFRKIRHIIDTIRNQPVYGSDGRSMQKLSEEVDDAYLQPNQQFEEGVASVDYDVWQSADASEQQIFRYEQFSKYVACPSCETVAYHLTGDRTLIAATYDSTGEGEKTYTCDFCHYVKKTRYTIAKKQRSSSSSSGSSGSSGGSSWGGGSSGGGGSGSSW